MPLTKEEIANLRELFEKTTQAEWRPSINRVDFLAPLEYRHNWENDAAWIAAAHNAMPALLATLDEKERELAREKVLRESWTNVFGPSVIEASERLRIAEQMTVALRAELQQANERVRELEAAITKTVTENGHLADGDDCTLTDLKRVMPELEQP